MANNYLTPGVYVQEISTLPGSVVEVQSAIPAFIGHTEKTRHEGRELKGVPEHIVSFKDFEARFGGGPPVDLKSVVIQTDTRGRFSQIDAVNFNRRFLLYEAMFMFFASGGGECYVVSTGDYNSKIEPDPFLAAIESLNAVDDVTLLVMPEAILLGESLYGVQQAALAHCAARQNRFAILDMMEESAEGKSILLNWKNAPTRDQWRKGCEDFRDRVGIMNLSYGAAYTPYIVADTRPALGYQDLRGKLKDGADKELPLASLDPAAEVAVNYLEMAMGDKEKLLEQVKSAREKLENAGKELTADEMKEEIGLPDQLRLNDVIIAANADPDKYKTSMKGTGKILDGMFSSLISDAPQRRKLVNSLEGLEAALDELPGNDADSYKVGREKSESAFQEMAAALKSALALNGRFADANDKAASLKTDLEGLPAEYDADPVAEAAKTVKDKFGELKKSVEDVYKSDSADSALTDDLSQHLVDLLKQLQSKMKNISDAEGEALNIGQLVEKVPAKNLKQMAALVDVLFCEDLYAAIVDNMTRLAEGLYSTSAAYRSIFDTVRKALKIQPPGAAMAGLYAATDNARGVWKAPANISLSSCLGLTQTINALEQETLNVDSVAGKSINAIRPFPGKGFLVWGARTLDGNNQEWRYVPVRRFFIMVEESVRRATSASVFEPNDANLWSKVKGMIDNYLIQKWKDGALMGAAPAEAFFVNVGLGQTMTEEDILDGRLIVDIGMAVVRPAEFIILRFMHKMQQA